MSKKIGLCAAAFCMALAVPRSPASPVSWGLAADPAAPAQPRALASPAQRAPAPRHAARLYHVAIGVDTTFPVLTVNTFIPRRLAIHAGDSVQWTNAVPNRPQTVTFGPVEATPPLITGLISGTLEINPQVVQPQGGHTVGNVSQNTYSSGALMGGIRGLSTRYTFTFRTPGTYFYRSLFHPAALGEIDVLPASASLPATSADSAASLARALRASAQALEDAHALESNAAAFGVGVQVAVGTGNNDVSVNKFTPAALVVPLGATVTWLTTETSGDFHAIVVGPNAAESAGRVNPYLGRARDGGLQFDAAYTSPTPLDKGQVVTDTLQTWNGHIISGLIYGSSVNAPSAVPASFTLTFKAPGEFLYADPFHPGMQGQITVLAQAP